MFATVSSLHKVNSLKERLLELQVWAAFFRV